MKIPEQLKSKLFPTTLLLIGTILGYFGNDLIDQLSVSFWQQFVQVIPTRAWVSATFLLTGILIVLVSYILYLHYPYRIVNKYRFDPLSGISYHKKTGKRFCTRCLYNKLEIQLGQGPTNKEWVCMLQNCVTNYTERTP